MKKQTLVKKQKSNLLEASLVQKATAQVNELKETLMEISSATIRSTSGIKGLTKTGKPLTQIARNAAVTYPEVLPGRFDVEDFDNKLIFDSLTEPLMSLINDTVDTFLKVRLGNSADLEYMKRKIYSAITAAALEDDKYSYYANQLAAEYEGQGKRSDDSNKNGEESEKKSSKNTKK